MALEQERITARSFSLNCPICHLSTQLLTLGQAEELLQVTPENVSQWLAEGKLHGVSTPGGQRRICSRSLFR